MSKYVEREEALIKAMKTNKFELFDGNADEAYDTLERALTRFPEYVNVVVREQVMMPIWRNRYEGQEWQDKVKDIDETRHIRHEAAISSISMLNRLCKLHGLPPFADIDTSDRYAVADFVGEYVSEVYEGGIHKNMDSLTKDSHKEYPTNKIQQRIRELDAKFDFTNPTDTGAEYHV